MKTGRNENNIKQTKAAYGRTSSLIGIVSNALLCSFKFFVGFLSGSSAIISDAANNLSDVASSSVSLVGFKLASKPADEKHPFGHGRYEYILSLVISFFVMLMGAELLKSAVTKILNPVEINYSPFVLAVLIASIIVKLCLGALNLYFFKKSGLRALKAVSVDSFSDCVSTFGVLVSVLLSRFFGLNIDAYIGAAVSLLVIWSGIEILKDSLSPLLGKPADKKLAGNIESFILEFNEAILGVHDLVLHDYGMGSVFAVAHVEMPDDMTLNAVHEIIDNLEKCAGETFSVDLVLHADPVDICNNELEKLKAQVETIVKSVDRHYTIHDFRLSADKEKMFFDLVIDSDIKEKPEKIEDIVKLRIESVLGNKPEAVINAEFPFVNQT